MLKYIFINQPFVSIFNDCVILNYIKMVIIRSLITEMMNLFYGSNTNSLLHFIHYIIIFNSNEQDGRQDILDYWHYEGCCKSSQSDQDTLLECK